MPHPNDEPNDGDTTCIGCEEGMKEGECPNSKRTCGHHCNCSWIHDVCCWCGEEFGENEMEEQ